MQIIPIAGKGNRFKVAGYKTAKYLLPLNGKPIIEHILHYFNKNHPTLLILNKSANDKKEINNILISLGFTDFEVIEIEDTDGQLRSVVNGVKESKYRDYNGPFWIYNGDTIRKKEIPNNLFLETRCEGFIEVFKESGNHWSFVDSLGFISKITEKDRISEYCCTGLYGFRKLNRIIEYVDSGSVLKLKDELYVSGTFENILNEGLNVWAFESNRNDFLLCGTPEEYNNVIKELT
jgi:dTDP-glucose pyrophosphorylase